MIERCKPFMLRENKWGVIWSREVDDEVYIATVILGDDQVENTKREFAAFSRLEDR